MIRMYINRAMMYAQPSANTQATVCGRRGRLVALMMMRLCPLSLMESSVVLQAGWGRMCNGRSNGARMTPEALRSS